MDLKINFLVRWANAYPESRMNDVFKGLLETTIDLIDLSRSVLEALSKDKRLKDFIDFEEILGSPRNEHAKHRVLIMKSYSDKEFWCLDLEREKWFIVTSRSYDEEWFCRNNVISGSRSTVLSEIYFMDKVSSSVQILDLERDTCKTYNFVIADRRTKAVQLFSMVENVYVVEVIEKMNVDRLNYTLFSPEVDLSSLLNYISCQRTMKSGGCCNIDMSTLYIGTMDNECIEMSRILGFEGFGISQICANKVNSRTIVAVLFKTKKHVSVLDIDNRKIETKQIETDDSDKLERCEDGFVIYNGARCICLTNLELSTLSTKYDVKEILFENKDDCRHSKYLFRGNNWYRYYHEIPQDRYQFETALHNDVISNMSFKKLEWKPLPLPGQISKLFNQHMHDLLFQISLPKSKLLCDIECPHCKFAGRATGNRESTWSSDTDDLYYDDGYDYYFDSD
ncbi:uncharacterized protein LOC123548626 isoform X1 [Mercenaria mercenaria]|uniref:uncharacterized protein LOC123548626 isoform X1 n=1 Tax=Mercenaria mercenaria TaxID=6596 RepID=UPI00234E5BF1|nr:uncharacterized protein LOC123548626 isoform X1 [Mercenaria mercenaria]